MSQPETIGVPYIRERSSWDAIVETAYENMVDYLLRDQSAWMNVARAQYDSVKLRRPQRLRRKFRNGWSDARYAVGHWIAGPCPEPEY